MNRRDLLKAMGALALVPAALRPSAARAAEGQARRVIFFYYPDGVAGPSQNGEPSLWHPTGGETGFSLPACSEPLEAWRDHCVWFTGLSMGGTDSGSHPGGAKKLLTASDGGNGESIDQYLSRTVGANSPWRHLYLGAGANANNPSGDKHITYFAPGQSITPEDNPRRAFQALFGSGGAVPTPSTGGGVAVDPVKRSVLDAALAELDAYRTRLGAVEQTKLSLHLDALREVERRIVGSDTSDPLTPVASCDSPSLDTGGFGDGELYDPSRFPAVLRAQIDLMVLAMACGMTRVGTIQGSQHTSELIMSRFPGSEMYDPGFDMRSHQASHYGASHDASHREFADYVKQRRWWASQFGYLLQRLADTPEGDGSMLDHSLVVLCTEVCDGNTHLHDNMPFLLAGSGGGSVRTGRHLDVGYRRHGDLWVSVGRAMGASLDRFGDASSGVVPGLLA
ncbi:MAG: DUF1552 domain-containing protein [Alphaproteobacteria bacterium]|nr:DUF1552 domain-containing protein [Alphaproteobacteria bacterium]